MKRRKIFTPALHLGTNIAAGMFIFAAIGYYLDNKFHQEQNLYTLGGIFLGLFYCGYEVWKVIQQSNQEDK